MLTRIVLDRLCTLDAGSMQGPAEPALCCFGLRHALPAPLPSQARVDALLIHGLDPEHLLKLRVEVGRTVAIELDSVCSARGRWLSAGEMLQAIASERGDADLRVHMPLGCDSSSHLEDLRVCLELKASSATQAQRAVGIIACLA